MWYSLADFILRYRRTLLVVVLLSAVGMGYTGLSNFHISQHFVRVVPPSDPDYQAYMDFLDRYGEDAGTLIIGLRGEEQYSRAALNELYAFTMEVKSWEGIQSATNITRAAELVVDTVDSVEQFRLVPRMQGPLADEAAARELSGWFLRQPFYEGVLYSPDHEMSVFMVNLDRKTMRSKRKHKLIGRIKAKMEAMAQTHGYAVHFAGVPYLRYFNSTHLPLELGLFSGAALLFTALALFLIFRSIYAVVFPLILLSVSTLVTIGFIGLLGYNVSILMGILPPVIIILGIPPSIYMLSEYHREYRKTGDKIEAIRHMFSRLGLVTLMIIGNTAFGFLTLYFTNVIALQEFGLVAFLGTMCSYLWTIVLIPGVFSMLPPPVSKRLSYLDSARINRFVEFIVHTVEQRRPRIYLAAVGIVLVSFAGITQLDAVTHMTDDMPKGGQLRADLDTIQAHFDGAMPMEILVNTHRPDGALRLSTLSRVNTLQREMEAQPELSRTLSVVDIVKWGRQALAGGDPDAYQMPLNEELSFIKLYASQAGALDGERGSSSGGPSLTKLTDTARQEVRISAFVRDIGSKRMPALVQRIQAKMDSLFPNNANRVQATGTAGQAANARPPATATITGMTRLFLKANAYLMRNLRWSLLAAFLIIGIQMLVLFGSLRIMLFALVPNLIPLLMTAALMGFMDVSLKPSTALIYIMAFGIAVDDGIHFLSMYHHERRRGLSVHAAVVESLRGTGMSMVYTSIVLFFGFIMFVPSSFGSTQSMGTLTAITLFFAMFANLFLLPSFLIQFDKRQFAASPALIEDAEADAEDEQPSPAPGVPASSA